MKTNNLLIYLAFVAFLFPYMGFAEDGPRISVLLNKGWEYKPIRITDKNIPYTQVTIPHTWNASYLKGTTDYNRETMVYRRDLELPLQTAGKRFFLYFEGVNSVADVFINHRTVGQHRGGYTAFCLEITDFVQGGKNLLEVWASNAFRTDVLPISGDFNVYGGIHRPCHLIVTDENCISPLFYASPGVLIHQDSVTDNKAEFTVETILSLRKPSAELSVKTTVFDAKGKIVAEKSGAVTEEHVKHALLIDNPILWNGKENPYLYSVRVELFEDGKLIDCVKQETGFRYYTVDADKGFFLNGKPLSLYGFCRHEDFAGKGSALSDTEYARDMELINEVGATAMRLAHYPHGERMYDLCDKNGIILWTEIPMCGPGGYDYTGYLHNQGFEENARQVTRELVYQKYDHPSICFWGIFNELLISDGVRFQEYDNPVAFVKEINALFKELDPSRLTAFATCVDQSHYLGCADLVAWNKYFSWKDSYKQASDFFDEARATSKGYPVGVSEYGAAGSVNHHACIIDGSVELTSRMHPEEYQAVCHEGYWKAFTERPFLWAKLIWQFSDMQSSIRKEGDTDGMNDKGAVSYDRKTKKDIFYFYKANWNPEPMLYITSRRFTQRDKAETWVKVYSNLKKATLYINGVKIGTQANDGMNRMIWPKVLLNKGENQIRVEGRNGKNTIVDTCTWYLE